MTEQEVFNKVYVHLLKQNAKSVLSAGCAYRGKDGRMCAVGCLIPDGQYSPRIETFSVSSFTVREVLYRSGVVTENNGRSMLRLLGDLQQIHDEHTVEFWKVCLEDLAKRRNFTIPEMP